MQKLVISCLLTAMVAMVAGCQSTRSVPKQEAQGIQAVELRIYNAQPSDHFSMIRSEQAFRTPVQKSFSGFIRMEIWENPNRPEELLILSWWQSLAALQEFNRRYNPSLDRAILKPFTHEPKPKLEEVLVFAKGFEAFNRD